MTLIKQEVEYFANDQSQKIYASQECSAVCSVDTRLHGVLRDWALVVGARLIWNWKCCWLLSISELSSREGCTNTSSLETAIFFKRFELLRHSTGNRWYSQKGMVFWHLLTHWTSSARLWYTRWLVVSALVLCQDHLNLNTSGFVEMAPNLSERPSVNRKALRRSPG